MKGVRFDALTAPGPSGTRPEHAKEAFGIRQKPMAARLARAMSRVQHMITSGEVPYVNMGLFGPHGHRMVKRQKLMAQA